MTRPRWCEVGRCVIKKTYDSYVKGCILPPARANAHEVLAIKRPAQKRAKPHVRNFFNTPPYPWCQMLAHKPIALRQIGPKCAFFTNRAIEAFDEPPQRLLKRKASPLPLPQPTSPTPDTSAAPTFRSLSSCGGPEPPLTRRRLVVSAYSDNEDTDTDADAIVVQAEPEKPPVETRGLVSTLPALLKAGDVTSEEAERRCLQSLEANQVLDTVVAVDEMREAIAKTIKDMHSGAPCLYRHLTFAVLIMLMKRGIPKRAIHALIHERYRVFDVKMLYYGDFKGRTVHVADRDAGWKTGTIIAYHPFDGFVAERWVGDWRERFEVTHDTDWVWGTVHKKSNS